MTSPSALMKRPDVHVAGFVQARTGSSRLPGKVLLPLGGKPLVLNITDRVGAAKRVDTVIIGTSDAESDDGLAACAEQAGLICSRGPVDDIVGRLHKAATETGAGILVRIWGDCPFIAPDIIDQAVDALIAQNADFVTNGMFGARTFPPGLDLEVYRAGLLARIDAEVSDPKLREFPVEFIKANAGTIRQHALHYSTDLSQLHLTIDYPEDLEAARRIYDALAAGRHDASFDTLVDMFRRQPELVKGFAQRERNIEYVAYLAARASTSFANK